MWFPVDLMRVENIELLMDATCAFFILPLPPILSFVSVVFDFNASLSDAAPVSQM